MVGYQPCSFIYGVQQGADIAETRKYLFVFLYQAEIKVRQKAYTEVRRAKKAAARLVAPVQIAASEGAEVEPGKRCLYALCQKPITGRGAYHDYCDYYCYMAEFRRAYKP